jgi:hypothetical protein
MAEAEQAIVELLVADATIASLVSTRVYYAHAPQNVALPFVVLSRISGIRDHVLGGTVSLVEARVQIDTFATSVLAARAIANAIREEINGFRGTQSGVDVQAIQLIDEADGLEGDSEIWRVTSDYKVWYQEY